MRRVLYLQNPLQGQYYAGVGTIDDGGTGEYEGLYLSARKTLSHNVSAQANYTWSHCISDPYNENPTSTGVAPPTDRRQFRSNCIGVDLRQEFVLNMVATTPKFSNKTLRAVASNWQIAPIVELKSATVFQRLRRHRSGADDGGKPDPEPGKPGSVSGQSDLQQLDQQIGICHRGSRHLWQPGL